MTASLKLAHRRHPQTEADPIAALRLLERRALWLSAWTIHHANHVRRNRDGLKVGGHQASLRLIGYAAHGRFFGYALRAQDRIAVKPHAAPVFHALMYLMGAQSREALERFRALGGAQSYPSRTKDAPRVDFSTGSVGLGGGRDTCSRAWCRTISALTNCCRSGPGA